MSTDNNRENKPSAPKDEVNAGREFAALIAKSTGLREQQVANTIRLLETGATIPFISRYRKEATEIGRASCRERV